MTDEPVIINLMGVLMNTLFRLISASLIVGFFWDPLPAHAVTPAVSTSGGHTLALKSDGTALAWGADFAGQLGLGRPLTSTVPIAVNGLPPIRKVASGSYHNLALATDGRVWAWGSNLAGGLADGGTIAVRSSGAPVKDLSGVVSLAAGDSFSLALKDDGSVWAWGRNDVGQLGDGSSLRLWHRVLGETAVMVTS